MVLGIGLAVLLCITAGIVYAMRKRYTYELRHEKRCVMACSNGQDSGQSAYDY